MMYRYASAYNQHWHVPGIGTITGKEMIAIASSYISYQKKVRTVKNR